MDKRVIASIDKCVEVLAGYISARVSNAFARDEDLDEVLPELVHSVADLIRARVKIDKSRETVTEVEIPKFLNK